MASGATIKFNIPGLIDFLGENLNAEQFNQTFHFLQRQIGDEAEILSDMLPVPRVLKAIEGFTPTSPADRAVAEILAPLQREGEPPLESMVVGWKETPDGMFGIRMGDAVGEKLLTLSRQIFNPSGEVSDALQSAADGGNPILSPDEHFTADPGIRIKMIDGQKVRCFQVHYVCPQCGHKGRRFRPAGTKTVVCHGCFALLKVKPATPRGVGEGKEFTDYYGNYYVARELFEYPLRT